MRYTQECKKLYRMYINSNESRATIHFCKKVYTFQTRRTRIIAIWKRLSAVFAGYIISWHKGEKTEEGVLSEASHTYYLMIL